MITKQGVQNVARVTAAQEKAIDDRLFGWHMSCEADCRCIPDRIEESSGKSVEGSQHLWGCEDGQGAICVDVHPLASIYRIFISLADKLCLVLGGEYLQLHFSKFRRAEFPASEGNRKATAFNRAYIATIYILIEFKELEASKHE